MTRVRLIFATKEDYKRFIELMTEHVDEFEDFEIIKEEVSDE